MGEFQNKLLFCSLLKGVCLCGKSQGLLFTLRGWLFFFNFGGVDFFFSLFAFFSSRCGDLLGERGRGLPKGKPDAIGPAHSVVLGPVRFSCLVLARGDASRHVYK
ncbi:hypothetical protein SUVC_12G1700 [Saccharomyces uvarum]|uniref:Uncharacterized protein n=1 Tax=Saccharomyces uvarum TaxID=230603 RepID=A0AA35NK51_SACUV|nr:hypothetical protein SUVC_12G1700 [Saccharomyces uvarum]